MNEAIDVRNHSPFLKFTSVVGFGVVVVLCDVASVPSSTVSSVTVGGRLVGFGLLVVAGETVVVSIVVLG